MPELPEVETIRRQLARAIKGARIKNVIIKSPKPLKVSKNKFIKAATGAKIKEIGRRAKLLIFELSSKSNILFHLKMTGRMLLAGKKEKPTKHTHIVFELSGSQNLFFEDYRKFGFVDLLDKKELEKYFERQGFGPEPLSSKFTYKIMKACFLARKNKKIKQLLMEQTCVAGIGNIYASEICFYAGAHPEKQVEKLTEGELKKIYSGIRKILRAAIVSKGSSSDAYLDAHGKEGKYVPKLKVYGRMNKKCVQCGGVIKKIKLGGRGTFFCSKCQK